MPSTWVGGGGLTSVRRGLDAGAKGGGWDLEMGAGEAAAGGDKGGVAQRMCGMSRGRLLALLAALLAIIIAAVVGGVVAGSHHR